METITLKRYQNPALGSVRAFTLVEIMIVVAIIGLLAAIAIPSFMKARTETQTTLCVENMRVIFHASHLYEIETGNLMKDIVGSNGASLRNTLVNNGYVRKRAYFECPVSPVADYDDYTLVYAGDGVTSVRCTINGDHILP
jgi:prepilin-type N-terminal cleavage/methylation domain-containing protein